MYQEGPRFTVDSTNWTDFVAPSRGCDYIVFINEGPGDVEYRQDKNSSLTGKIIAAGTQQSISATRVHTGSKGLPRFTDGQVIGSFKAVSGTAAIFPTLS